MRTVGVGKGRVGCGCGTEFDVCGRGGGLVWGVFRIVGGICGFF